MGHFLTNWEMEGDGERAQSPGVEEREEEERGRREGWEQAPEQDAASSLRSPRPPGGGQQTYL